MWWIALIGVFGFANSLEKTDNAWRNMTLKFPVEAAKVMSLKDMAIWKSKMFFAIPRDGSDLYPTLTYIDFKDVNVTSPKFISYPNRQLNDSTKTDNQIMLKNACKIQIDDCDRLWVMDEGISDARSRREHIRLVIFDLQTNKLIRVAEFKNDVVENYNFFDNCRSFVVDAEKNSCKTSFAYIISHGSDLIVYNWENDEFWRRRFLFKSTPLIHDIDGHEFTLGPLTPNKNGSKILYIRHIPDYNMTFGISNKNLQNKSIASTYEYINFDKTLNMTLSMNITTFLNETRQSLKNFVSSSIVINKNFVSDIMNLFNKSEFRLVDENQKQFFTKLLNFQEKIQTVLGKYTESVGNKNFEMHEKMFYFTKKLLLVRNVSSVSSEINKTNLVIFCNPSSNFVYSDNIQVGTIFSDLQNKSVIIMNECLHSTAKKCSDNIHTLQNEIILAAKNLVSSVSNKTEKLKKDYFNFLEKSFAKVKNSSEMDVLVKNNTLPWNHLVFDEKNRIGYFVHYGGKKPEENGMQCYKVDELEKKPMRVHGPDSKSENVQRLRVDSDSNQLFMLAAKRIDASYNVYSISLEKLTKICLDSYAELKNVTKTI